METIREAGPKLKSFFYHVCKPEDKALVRGVVLVLHGAEGHGGRYEPFGNELVKQGYVMCSIDHLGHGLDVFDKKDDLGKWEKDDFHYSTYNAYYLVDKLKNQYPGKPIYLLGDDYGGTMAQYILGEFGNVCDGIIIASCGIPTLRDRRMLLKTWFKKVMLYDGAKSKGTFRSRTAFLNRKYKPTRTKYDWLNSDPNEVDRFIEDPLAGFVATIGYYYYQYKYINLTPYFVKLKKVDRNIPIMFIGGKNDHITKQGAQIEKLKAYYAKKGFANTEIKLYDNSRHDVLLEWNKDKVAEDVADFINKNSYKQEVFEVKKEIKVITLKEEEKPIIKEAEVVELKEEEPEDDLKLSTELKK